MEETKKTANEQDLEAQEAQSEEKAQDVQETQEEAKVEETKAEAKEEKKQEEAPAKETAEAQEEEKVKKLPASKKGRGKRGRKIETVKEAPVSEWQERVVQIRRVTKVCKGGKKLSFRAIVVVGNCKGQVGVGVAKAAEVIVAIQKAVADGRKNLVTVPVFKTTIPHEIQGRAGAGSVKLRPASKGTGVIAGGAIRAVLELAGIENILSKSLGSKGPLNNANATIDALKNLRNFKDVAARRGLTLNEMLN